MTWHPIDSAPKDGTWILVRVRKDRDFWAGRIFHVRHEGYTPSGFDLGWSLFPGFGGCSDKWFDGWMPPPPEQGQ